MADETAEIVIDPEVSAAAAAGTGEVKPEEGIEDLRRQLETLRTEKLEALRRAESAESATVHARGEVDNTNLQLVVNAIDAVKSSTETLRGKYRDAMAVGDFDTAATLTVEMTSNAAKMQQLEAGKLGLEERAKNPPRPQPPADPVERFAQSLTPRSGEWIRKNPQFVTDRRLNQKMIAAHNIAMADGLAPDTDAYFEAVEGVLGMKRAASPREPDADPMEHAAKPRQSAPPAAPVSRSGTGTGERAGTVRLSALEIEAAQLSGLTNEEYAKNKRAIAAARMN